MENRIAGHQLIAGRGPIGRPGAPPRIAEYLSCAGLAWGVFAFGTVYAWGYWPLAAVCGAAGMLRLHARDRFGLADGTRELALLLGAVACAALLQVLPLPVAALGRLNPQRGALLDQLDVRMAHGLIATHTLSLDAASTWRALALFVCFGLLMLGVARSSTRGALRIAWFIAWLGIAVALTGIIQKPLFAGAIYGFWKPLMPGTPFGPFINKNHFAGWMLMALPIPLGLMGGAIARAAPAMRMGIRERILWLGSPDASEILLWSSASAIMGVSLMLTMSRSGMAVAAVVLLATGAGMLRGERRGRGTATVFLVITAVAFAAVAWTGGDAIAGRFGEPAWASFNGRQGAWLDAIGIARSYPLAGTGFNTYGVATLFYQKHDLWAHYAQAHNDYLQLAAEGGLLLGIPALACVALFCTAVRKRFREETSVSTSWIRAGAVTGIAAVALQEMVDFSLQMPGNAFLFAVLCAIALHRTPERQRRSRAAVTG